MFYHNPVTDIWRSNSIRLASHWRGECKCVTVTVTVTDVQIRTLTRTRCAHSRHQFESEMMVSHPCLKPPRHVTNFLFEKIRVVKQVSVSPNYPVSLARLPHPPSPSVLPQSPPLSNPYFQPPHLPVTLRPRVKGTFTFSTKCSGLE